MDLLFSSSLPFTPPQSRAWPWTTTQDHEHPDPIRPTTAPKPTRIKINLPRLLHPVDERIDGSLKSSAWLPRPPSIQRPQANYNAASLAYLGDCVYELYVRNHFLTPPQRIERYNNLVMGLVCCEAQDALLKRLLKDDFLSEEERSIVRWGRNVESGQRKATRRAGTAVYCGASSLETLIGYLYLTNSNRLEQVMNRLGLCCQSNMEDRKLKLEIDKRTS